MLCHECEEYRFPSSGTGPSTRKQTQSKTKQSATDRVSRNTPVTRYTDNRPNASSSATTNCTNVPATPPGSTSINDLCPRCCEATDSTSLRCDICNDVYHDNCIGLSTSVRLTLEKIIKDVGWVCIDCRTTCRTKIKKLQSQLSRTNEELSTLCTLMAELRQDIDCVKASTSIRWLVSANASE